MEIETQYAVKLFFANSAFVQVYFEAVANAFDAHATHVSIVISTDGQISPEFLEVSISDNGVGFTDERFERFRRLAHPIDSYHKGLGRLVYLHYFENVSILSTFNNRRRSFVFSNAFKGTCRTEEVPSDGSSGTTLTFKGFAGTRLRSYEDIKPGALKERLLEHFLPLFYEKKRSNTPFRVSIELKDLSQTAQRGLFAETQFITEADVPALECKTIQDNQIDIFASISMHYMLRAGVDGRQIVAICIDGRTIPMPKLLSRNAIPHNHTAIFLFESDLFAGKSDSARQRLVLPDTISESTLTRVLRREMSSVLSEKLPEIETKNAATRKQFEDRYPHLVGLFDEDTVGLIDRDEAIEKAQNRFFKEQKAVLESDTLDDATFAKSLEFSSRTLTEYVLYRELIIKRLREMTQSNKEADVHNLIVPQRKVLDKVNLVDEIYTNNAWLLDDKFMSFRTILSEAKMHDVIDTITLKSGSPTDEGRPDIAMIFSADPDHVESVDVVVVEIKRRTVDDKENPYAATQLVKRARKLADYWPSIQRVWYFAIIEIDESLSQLLIDLKWTPLFSRGKVFYQEFPVRRTDGVIIPTPVCLLSFDAVIQDAAARNHTFLELLKSDLRRAGAAIHEPETATVNHEPAPSEALPN